MEKKLEAVVPPAKVVSCSLLSPLRDSNGKSQTGEVERRTTWN